MIYFLHIKNAEEIGCDRLNCKLFFNTIEEILDYFKDKLPSFVKHKYYKEIKKLDENGNKILGINGLPELVRVSCTDVYEDKDLEKQIEKFTEILIIDEKRIPGYEKLFKGKFL